MPGPPPAGAAKPAPVTLSRSPLGSVGALRGAAAAAAGPAFGGGSGGSSAGGGSDDAYDDLLRRLRDEQEQLGQLIQHPF
jgi:hypothetical protein